MRYTTADGGDSGAANIGDACGENNSDGCGVGAECGGEVGELMELNKKLLKRDNRKLLSLPEELRGDTPCSLHCCSHDRSTPARANSSVSGRCSNKPRVSCMQCGVLKIV